MANLVGKAVFGATTDVHTSALNKVGTRAFDSSGNEYIYMQGVGSVVQYDWVVFDEDLVTVRAVADAQGRVAVAQAAIAATTSYGWFQIYGKTLATALTGFLDNADVYLTGTAGAVDDTDVAGDAVIGAKGRSALSGTTALFDLNYPYVNDAAID